MPQNRLFLTIKFTEMKTRYIISIILLITLSCTRPLNEEQKNSDAVFIKMVKEYTLNPDGSSLFRYHHKLLYNSYFAFHRLYGESFIIYNPQYQTLKVTKSETRMADGKKIQSPPNAYNEVLPGQAADAPAYNYLREMVVTHVGLEVGAVVELEYEIETKPGFMPFMADRVNFFESSPIQDLEVIVNIPEGEDLYKKFLNKPEGIEYVHRSVDDFDVYAWKGKNLKATSHEPLQPEGLVDYPILLFSTADLSTSVNFLKTNLTNSFVPDKSFTRLIEGCKLKGWDKVEYLTSLVAHDVNTYGVTPQYVAYNFRSPEQVWKSNGGTEGEKVILLYGMLKLAGFDAQPVIAGYPHLIAGDVGCPLVFDRYYVRVEFEGEKRYYPVNMTHEKIPGKRIPLAINEDVTSKKFEQPSEKPFTSSLEFNLVFSDKGTITGNGKAVLNSYDPEVNLFTNIITSQYIAEVQSEKPDSVVCKIKLRSEGIKIENNQRFSFFSMPLITQGISSVKFGELPTERATRLQLPSAYSEKYCYKIDLPDGIKIISPKGETVVENNLGSFRLKVETEGNLVKITRSIDISEAAIPVEDYTKLRQLVSYWVDNNLAKVVFKEEY